eukprot:gene20498-27289_t
MQRSSFRVGGTKSALQSWRYRVSHAELAVQSQLCRVGALAVQSQLCRVGGADQAIELAVTRVSYAGWRTESAMQSLAVPVSLCRVAVTESSMQSWRYRVSYAELAVQSQLCRVGGTESAMQSLATGQHAIGCNSQLGRVGVQSQLCRVGVQSQPAELAVQISYAAVGGYEFGYADLAVTHESSYGNLA